MDYVWFEPVTVVRSDTGMGCQVIVNGKRVPLPVTILHPDCMLEKVGDVGRLGVPLSWAREHGLTSAN